MPQTDADKTIALAGLSQATHMVRDIARTGGYDGDDFATCVYSLFKIDAADSADVFGGVARLKTGLRLLTMQLKQPQDLEVTRYMLNLFSLERKLDKQPAMLRRIRAGIERLEPRFDPNLSATDEDMLAALAELYAATVSTLSPRVMVNGEQAYLSRSENVNRIRTLLLAGVRAARLWRQSGGGQLTMMLKRGVLLQTAERILAQLDRG